MNKNLELMINEIKKGLASEDVETRKKSVLMLSRIDAPEVIDALEPLKDDESEEIRTISAKIINILSQKYTQSAPLVSREHKSEIKAEIERSEFDVEILSRYLSSGIRETKIAAVSAFYGVKNSAALGIFKKKLTGEKDVAVIATLVKAIGTIGSGEEIDFLTGYINHPDNRVKANAIEALCLLGANYEVFAEVLQLINCSDERVRITAFQYFSRIDKDVMISEVDNILSSADDDLKALAVRLTFFYDADLFIGLYEKYFEGFNNELKSSVIKNLKEVVSPRALEFVQKYDAVDFAVDFIDPSFMEDKTGRDIFDIEKGIKKDEEFFFEEGMLLFDLGNLERCIVELNRATRVNPKFVKAWKQKAVVYTQMDNYKKALDSIDRALELNPQDDDAIYSKALILQQSGDDRAAEKCFKASRKINFTSNVFTKDKEKKFTQTEIKDTIDKLIGETDSSVSVNEGTNDAIDRLIDEINDGAIANIGVNKSEAFKLALDVSLDEASTRLPGREAGAGKNNVTGQEPLEAQEVDEEKYNMPLKKAEVKKVEVEAAKQEVKKEVKEEKEKEPAEAKPQKTKAGKAKFEKKNEKKNEKEADKTRAAEPEKNPEVNQSLTELKGAPDKKAGRAKKPKPEPAEDNFIRNAVITLVLFALTAFTLIGYYYNSSNEVLTVISLAKHFKEKEINGEVVHLERFAYMDEAISERVDYKGVGFSIRILKVKTPAKAENIRKNRDEGRDWQVNGNFLIAIDRGDSQKILSAFQSFK